MRSGRKRKRRQSSVSRSSSASAAEKKGLPLQTRGPQSKTQACCRHAHQRLAQGRGLNNRSFTARRPASRKASTWATWSSRTGKTGPSLARPGLCAWLHLPARWALAMSWPTSTARVSLLADANSRSKQAGARGAVAVALAGCNGSCVLDGAGRFHQVARDPRPCMRRGHRNLRPYACFSEIECISLLR